MACPLSVVGGRGGLTRYLTGLPVLGVLVDFPSLLGLSGLSPGLIAGGCSVEGTGGWSVVDGTEKTCQRYAGKY
jgi:hypothetical protein